jgi:putative Mn2+ efflux pump MntP
VTGGVLLGRVLGVVVGKRAEIFGGVVLIGIGVRSWSSISAWSDARPTLAKA